MSDNKTEIGLRDKTVYLWELGWCCRYFELLLEKDKMTVEDKRFVEKMYVLVTKNYGDKNAV